MDAKDADKNSKSKKNTPAETPDPDNEKTPEKSQEKEEPKISFYDTEKFVNDSRKEYIKKRYEYYLDMFNKEKDFDKYFLKSKWNSLKRHSGGILWGAVDGFATGMCLGGKYGGAGGWIVGGIAQGVSIIVGPIVGAIHGAIVGAMSNKEEVAELLKDYRYTVGSTMGKEVVKPRTEFFPNYNKPLYLVNGDRQEQK